MFCLRSWIPVLFFLYALRSLIRNAHTNLVAQAPHECLTCLPRPLHFSNILPQPTLRVLFTPPLHSSRGAFRFPHAMVRGAVVDGDCGVGAQRDQSVSRHHI